jgi:hypothetical protein
MGCCFIICQSSIRKVKIARFGGGRGRWLAELFMLVNPTPKEKKEKTRG